MREIHANVRTGYGTYQTRMRTAAGSGLNTNFFTYIGPAVTPGERWDEIDFEFLGKNPRTVQLNYYVDGKGGHEKIVNLGFDASEGFHNYSFVWSPLKIKWYVDGKLVHETAKGEAAEQSGADLPPAVVGGAEYEWLAGAVLLQTAGDGGSGVGAIHAHVVSGPARVPRGG